MLNLDSLLNMVDKSGQEKKNVLYSGWILNLRKVKRMKMDQRLNDNLLLNLFLFKIHLILIRELRFIIIRLREILRQLLEVQGSINSRSNN